MSVAEPPPKDRATDLSLQYVEAVKRWLRPHVLQNGDPILLPDSIRPSTVIGLAKDLHDVLRGNAGANARVDAKACGAQHVQAVAFGSIQDFTLSMKVGMLYSRRVVLWDILALRCADIANKIHASRAKPLALPTRVRDHIADIAENVLSLEALFSEGAAIVLPHPSTWSSDAVEAQRRAAAGIYGMFYRTHLGVLLAAAQAVAKELNVHPYNIHDYNMPLPSPEELSLFMSRQNQLLQRSYADVILDTRFEYVENITIKQFYELVKDHCDVAEELKTWIGELGGQTEQQWAERLAYVRRRLSASVDRQNQALKLKSALEIGGPLLGAALSIGGVQGVLAGIGGFAEAAAAALPGDSVGGHLVSFFCKAKSVQENSPIVLPTGEPL